MVCIRGNKNIVWVSPFMDNILIEKEITREKHLLLGALLFGLFNRWYNYVFTISRFYTTDLTTQ